MTVRKGTAQIAWQGDPRIRRFQEEMARRRSEEARRIGANIAALRERHHLTQEAAAVKLKVAYRTYQSWEQGTNVPRWSTRERIAKFYGVRVEEVNGPALPRDDAASDSQLDRIEAKLDEVLTLLTSEGVEAAGAREELETCLPAEISQAASAPKRPAR